MLRQHSRYKTRDLWIPRVCKWATLWSFLREQYCILLTILLYRMWGYSKLLHGLSKRLWVIGRPLSEWLRLYGRQLALRGRKLPLWPNSGCISDYSSYASINKSPFQLVMLRAGARRQFCSMSWLLPRYAAESGHQWSRLRLRRRRWRVLLAPWVQTWFGMHW